MENRFRQIDQVSSYEESNAVRSLFGLLNPLPDPSDAEIELQNDHHEEILK